MANASQHVSKVTSFMMGLGKGPQSKQRERGWS